MLGIEGAAAFFGFSATIASGFDLHQLPKP
jgi:hypothetical protein